MPREHGQSGGEAGNAGEGKGASQDTTWLAEKLGDPLPSLLPPHLPARQCIPGVPVVITQLTISSRWNMKTRIN